MKQNISHAQNLPGAYIKAYFGWKTTTTTAHKRIQAEKLTLQDRFKSCFDTAKRKISKNAADPAKNYGFTKQKHICGDKTLKI